MGILLATAASLCWGVSTATGKSLSGKHDAKIIGFLRYFLAGVFAIAFSAATAPGPVLPSASASAWTLMLAVTGIAAATIVAYYQALEKVSLTAAAIIEASQPAWTYLISIAFFSESLPPSSLAGAALVLAGTFASSIPQKRKIPG
jgi:drug/metabolite transporter (DMT)-like permease